jgi:hypothetical protein
MTLAEENARFDDFIRAAFVDDSSLTRDVLDKFHELYPANDSALGAPFNTGDSLFDRAAAWDTEAIYLAPRRLFFNRAAGRQKLFGYYFAEFFPGGDPVNGGKQPEIILY